MVEALGRRYGYALQLREILIGNTLDVFKGKVLFQQFRGVVPRPDTRKPCSEIASASFTAELVTVYPQPHGIHDHSLAFYLSPEGSLGTELLPAAVRATVPLPAHLQNTRRQRHHVRYCHIRQTKFAPFHRDLLLWSEWLPRRHITCVVCFFYHCPFL